MKTEEPTMIAKGETAVPSVSSESAMKTQELKKICYKNYLLKMGYALGVNATVERLADTETQMSPLSNGKVVDEKVSSIEALVAKLNDELKGVTVVQSGDHPAVIHLIETALLQQQGYPLEQRLTLEYTGVPQGLLERLHEELPSLIPSSQFGISLPWLEDEDESDIAVNASHELVRKILADGAPARGDGEILFEAITSDRNGGLQVEVSYRPSLVSLEDYLYAMGDTLNVYFTIERLTDSKTHDSPLSVADVRNDEANSIEALVAKLNHELEGVTAVRSDDNPTVIHLIETSLLEYHDYPLEQQVTVEYTGTLDGLTKKMNELLPSVGPSTRGSFPIPHGSDYTTETSINASNKRVRKILVEAVPLEGYGRILFEAIAYDLAKAPQVEVSYFGPRAVQESETE